MWNEAMQREKQGRKRKLNAEFAEMGHTYGHN